MGKLMELPFGIERRRQFDFYDDFLWYVTAHEWTTVANDGGSCSVGDAAGGVLTISPSATDNNQAWIKFTNEVLLFAANKPIVQEGIIKFTEADTNKANIAFGFANAVADDIMIDDAGGPKTSFSGCMFYKLDGATVWRCRSSVGTSNTDTVTNITAGGSAYQRLRIEVKPNGSLLEASYFIDGQQVLDTSSGRPGLRLTHTIDPTSATEMQPFAGSKNGSASNQTLLVDSIGFGGLR